MNVFKLLSRSSKVPQNTSAQTLPSAGAAANPQLFGHDAPKPSTQDTKKNRKRKRGPDTTEPLAPLPADLDFFGNAPKADAADEAGAVSKRSKDRHANGGEETGVNTNDDADVYDEDEAKRILRSHKLKITVLEDFAPQVEDEQSEKKKKKKKKEKERDKGKKKEADKKKEGKKQLYPQPLGSFAQLRPRYNISRRLAENLLEQGYTVPTEVQLATLPLFLEKRKVNGGSSGAEYDGDFDLLTVAPTGSGKTIAFLIPIINALLSDKSEAAKGPRAVVIAPTRELASQIANEARKLSKNTGIKATLMMKGMEVVDRSEAESPAEELAAQEASDDEDEDNASDSDDEEKSVQQKKRKQTRAAKVKADILVATPLALLNAMKKKDGTVAEMSTVRHFVLDEADVLLDPLFREQTLDLWNAFTNPLLRVGLWSATMGSNVEALAISTLNTRWASLSSTSTKLPPRPPLIRLVVGLKDSAIPNIHHQLTYAATEQGKLLGLRQLLHPTAAPTNGDTPSLRPPFLIFTQTIPRAIALHSELLYDIPHEAGGSSRIAVLHADLSSSAREAIMTRFRRGEIWVLITTDLLSRGVDFRGLNGVVNYDVPNSAAAYVHRVGRTGRAGREGGVAVTFYTQEDIPYVKLIANVIRASEKLRGKSGDEASVKQWLLDALPAPTKREKQQLKKRGVEARRTPKGEDGKDNKRARISTKSGYVRKVENNRKGAMMANRQRGKMDKREVEQGSDNEFEGFD
ncbi:P-loop containing nucleoside triphosphate hydrolase protein [Massarina eburnea CBS 473.64]|uniref:ATP-dependent RNA helicase ROK1 n=1 Tax=Massarina eburnea CBS 473.64 TaxID=1395130 RepID=A0A6A6RS97_9PLEO|nr:P-loop containing nucleoside triphosphate hydrolase protein [Massarina eburnea CBS 473.64]